MQRLKIKLSNPQMNLLYLLSVEQAEDPGQRAKTRKYAEEVYHILKELPEGKHIFYLTLDQAFAASEVIMEEADWPRDGRSEHVANRVYNIIKHAFTEADIDYMKYFDIFYEDIDDSKYLAQEEKEDD